ncbi:MAG: sulfotransferase [Spirochaetes bacterium]|nr:sulfotransferase [Spirochaetota bacterium]
MTQKILGSHPQIHTQSEPWILLHHLHALKPENYMSAYNSDLYAKNLKEFISTLDGGEEEYKEKIAGVLEGFYLSLLNKSGKRFFLDKTPRYYLIIRELFEYFPEAKCIFLWRNPAAVLASIVHTWIKRDWYRLAFYKSPLLDGPRLLVDGKKIFSERYLNIKYEDLLANPEGNVKNICEYLGLPFNEEMLIYGNGDSLKWKGGDQGTVYEKDRPDSFHAEQWMQELGNPQLWRVVRDYVQYLGTGILSEMGYSYNEIMEILENNRPDIDIERHTVSLMQLLDDARDVIIANRMMVKQLESTKKEKDELLKEKDELLKEKGELLKEKDELLKEKDELLKKKDELLKKKDEELKNNVNEIKSIKSSYAYKIGKSATWLPRKSIILFKWSLENLIKIINRNALLILPKSYRDKLSLKSRGVVFINKSTINKKIKHLQKYNNKPRQPRLIVSLTSFPQRIKEVHYTIYSLLSQKIKPDMLILWLGEEQFSGKYKSLPKNLLRLQEKGLIIKWFRDIKSFKKLLPAIIEYPDDIIVTADDDIYYPENWLQLLYDSYLKNQDSIHCHRAHKIIFNDNGSIKPYLEWEHRSSIVVPSARLVFTGCGGVLYPPRFYYKDLLNEELYLDLTPTADDIWFWAMAILNGRKIQVVDNNISQLVYINPAREYGLDQGLTLFRGNGYGGQNDIQIQKILSYYPDIINILQDEKEL